MLPDGKHLADLEKKKMALNKEIGKLLDQSFKENDYTKYDREFKRLSDELTAVSKEITEEQERLNACAESAANVKDILDDIERREFRIAWFDDALVRHSVERVTIVDKHMIRVKIGRNEDSEITIPS